MRKNNPSQIDWKPCTPGSLKAFAGKELTRRRRRILAKAGGGVAILLLICSATYLTWGSAFRGEPNFGGITCTEVRANAMPYMAGRLEPELTQRIRAHLDQCPECQRFWKEMSGKAMEKVSLSSRPRSLDDCACDACRRQRLLAMREGTPQRPRGF